tara:strand:- start:354 stop:668 length:315 start_codon:yes stop_codon:yes gene_type:complete
METVQDLKVGMEITKVEAGEYNVGGEITLSWNSWESHTGQVRISKYRANDGWGTWGVWFDFADGTSYAIVQADQFFYTLAEAKEYFANGGTVEAAWYDGGLYLN